MQDWNTKPYLVLHYSEVRSFVRKFLFKRLVAHKPAQLDVLSILVECQEPNFCDSVCKAVADKANELQVVKVDNLLLLLMIGEVYHNQLSIVLRKPLVDQKWIVHVDCLINWLNDATTSCRVKI
jgi:hypothetical protein